MPEAPKSTIARFAPGKVLAAQAPSLAIGLIIGACALTGAFTVLTSDWITRRSMVAAPLMLTLFGVGAICVLGRGLVEAGLSGPAVEIEEGRLRAFTVGFAEMKVSEISNVRITGRGKSRRVVVHGEDGPRLLIRADIMKPDARTIAQAIRDARSLGEAG